MANLSESEKNELKALAGSESLKNDMRFLLEHRHNPVLAEGEVDLDRLLDFLTGFNEFINHEPKPFKPIVDRVMKL